MRLAINVGLESYDDDDDDDDDDDSDVNEDSDATDTAKEDNSTDTDNEVECQYSVSEDFDWRNVIFSDELIVSNSNDSTALVYCMNGHRYDERFVRRIINKSGCVRVAYWGGCHTMG
ncbi:hypothetical protein ANN_08600 [Periplaneta americana]|uniref:Uncharacterized protein n=1 Tax=Periplaneta americana TaxID=6978 RepID=A0ABQ8T1V4_PERAM|nr:hypothetical protein ANN_08600 [Periplaneta americana]